MFLFYINFYLNFNMFTTWFIKFLFNYSNVFDRNINVQYCNSSCNCIKSAYRGSTCSRHLDLVPKQISNIFNPILDHGRSFE